MTRFCVWVCARQSVYPHGEPSKFISVFGTCTFSSVQWKSFSSPLFLHFHGLHLLVNIVSLLGTEICGTKQDRNFLRRALSLCIVFKKKQKNINHSSSSFKLFQIWIYDYFLLWCNSSVHFVDLSLSRIWRFIWFLLSSFASSSGKHRCTETLFTGVRALLFLGRGRLDFSGA